jgi:hypothetical protein
LHLQPTISNLADEAEAVIQKLSEPMTRLILTTSDSGAGCLKQAGLADIVIPFGFRFVWGRLPSATEVASSLTRLLANDDPSCSSSLDKFGRAYQESHGKDLGLLELCQQCEAVELWIDPEPNAQLQLIQLLAHFRSDAKIISKLTLHQAKVRIGNQRPETSSRWRPSSIKVVNDHVDVGNMAWQAYRRPTPQDWFDLLGRDLSVLPQLRQAVLELLEELPMLGAGIGGTEMRMLELISANDAGPFAVFPGHHKPNKRRVFDYWEVGHLLDGLAHCPAPVVSGLDEGPFTEEMHRDRDRYERYRRSKLNLTEFGRAVLGRSDDFSRQNPIRRWWGGTKLTNECLWRWDPPNRALIDSQA